VNRTERLLSTKITSNAPNAQPNQFNGTPPGTGNRRPSI
jgi:hypothetical protein